MNVAATPARLDALDAERFREMLTSPPWLLFMRRLAAETARAQGDCERKDKVIDVRRAQGRMEAYRLVAALPEQILKDMEKPNQPR